MAIMGSTTGWVGVGWSPDGHMYSGGNSDAVVGWVESNGNVVVNAYQLKSYSPSAADIQSDFELTDIDGEEIDGKTIIYFTRSTKSGLNPIDADADVIVIGAYSGTNQDTFSYHGSSTHTSTSNLVVINFASGSVSSAKGKLGIRDAHAIIMLFAWGLLLPFGMLWARYTRNLGDLIWFKVHRVTQYSGFVIALAGIILAYIMVDPSFHFRVVAHATIGTVMLILMVGQVIGAFFRPHPKPVTSARIAFEIGHHWNGRVLVLLSVAQIILGIYAIGYDVDHPWLLPLYVAVAGSVALFVLIIEIYNGINPIWGIVPCFRREKEANEKDYVDADF